MLSYGKEHKRRYEGLLKSQELQIEKVELENKINQLATDIETRGLDDPETEAKMSERMSLFGQLNAKNNDIIEALKREDAEAQAAMARNADDSGWTAEMREFHQLGQRTSMAEYMRAGLQQRAVRSGTPEHEYNQHVFGNNFGPGEYPLEMLLDRSEHFSLQAWEAAQLQQSEDPEKRTEITGTAQDAGNLTFVDRLFSEGEGAYCRATYPVVGPGRHSYPIVSGNDDIGAAINRGTAESVAGGLSIVNSDAERIQHSYEVARVDEIQMPGVMEYLVRDLRQGLMAGLDHKVIRDLLTALTDTDVQAGTTLTTAGLIAGVHSFVDGRGARYFSECRLLAGNTAATSQTTAHARLGALMAATTLGELWTWFGNIRASTNFFAAAAGEDSILLIRMAPAPPRLIVPTWRRGEILRDTGRLQLQGAVTLTGVMYADVIVAGTDLHVQMKVETQ